MTALNSAPFWEPVAREAKPNMPRDYHMKTEIPASHRCHHTEANYSVIYAIFKMLGILIPYAWFPLQHISQPPALGVEGSRTFRGLVHEL